MWYMYMYWIEFQWTAYTVVHAPLTVLDLKAIETLAYFICQAKSTFQNGRAQKYDELLFNYRPLKKIMLILMLSSSLAGNLKCNPGLHMQQTGKALMLPAFTSLATQTTRYGLSLNSSMIGLIHIFPHNISFLWSILVPSPKFKT